MKYKLLLDELTPFREFILIGFGILAGTLVTIAAPQDDWVRAGLNAGIQSATGLQALQALTIVGGPVAFFAAEHLLKFIVYAPIRIIRFTVSLGRA